MYLDNILVWNMEFEFYNLLVEKTLNDDSVIEKNTPLIKVSKANSEGKINVVTNDGSSVAKYFWVNTYEIELVKTQTKDLSKEQIKKIKREINDKYENE